MLKTPFVRGAFVILAALTSPVFASDLKPLVPEDIPVSNDYILRTWDVYDGLPSNIVNEITQTSDGYLWLATARGVARFDGMQFTTFFKTNTPGLESDKVRSIFAARDGALWLGLGRGGVSRFMSGHFQTIVPLVAPTERTEWTSSFAEDAGGGIWFGYAPDLKVFRWQDGKLSSYSDHDGIAPGNDTFVQADAKGVIWFSTTEAFGFFDGHRFKRIEVNPNAYAHLAPSREGGMWALDGALLLRYDAEGKRETIANLEGLSISVLHEDRSGDLWIGVNNHDLLRLHEGTFAWVPISHTHVSSIAEDREGNLWVGTLGGGLDRLRPRAFSLRQLKDGLVNDGIVSLCQDSEGRLWLAGVDGTVVRALDATNQTFAVPAGWPKLDVLNLYATPTGEVWCGTLGAGLIHWQNGIFTEEPLPGDITALLQDREGDLWASIIKKQLVRRHNGQDDFIPSDGGLVQPRALAEDSSGGIWVGTEKGLVFQRQSEHFTPVPLPGARPDEAIRFIVPDGHDTVWIGAYSGGLYRWHAGQVKRLSTDAGLPVDDLRVMAIEPDGHFWFGTGRGLFRVERSEMEAVIDGTLSSLQVTSYGRNDGLPSVDFSYGFRNATTRTQDGHLWFATYSGALEVDPQKLRKETPQEAVLIEEIQLGGKTLRAGENREVSLPPNPGPVQIHYTLPEVGSPEQIRFRYRLLGLGNEEWVEVGAQRVATFASLPPGQYRFIVEAAESEGPWLPGTAFLPISVQAAWWQTSLFRIGTILFVSLALAGVARAIELRRVRARMRRLKQQNALERERTRIARDMHDHLGASLTQIGLFAGMVQAESAERSASAEHASRVVASAREAVTALDEIVWAINPSNDNLSRLLEYLTQYAADFLHTANLRCRFDLPAEIPSLSVPADFRHNLFLIVQEALNNVVKHAAAKEVRICIKLNQAEILLEIADDGCGISDAVRSSAADGLVNFARRTADLGGTCQIDSKPGRGTSLKFNLPLPYVRKTT